MCAGRGRTIPCMVQGPAMQGEDKMMHALCHHCYKVFLTVKADLEEEDDGFREVPCSLCQNPIDTELGNYWIDTEREQGSTGRQFAIYICEQCDESYRRSKDNWR